MKNFELFDAFVFRTLGKPLRETIPAYLTGSQVAAALWPLLEELRPNFPQISALPYDATFEKETDEAISARFLSATVPTWAGVSAGAWRVWLERLQQMVIVAELNETAGNSKFMPVPSEFPEAARTGAAVLFFLHGMKLPQPPSDQSGAELPQWSARGTLLRH